jgi:UDP-glucose 4-epimerase
LFRAAMTGEPVQIFGDDYPSPDGTCLRDYIHVGDLASAHLAALDHLLAGGESAQFNVGTGEGRTVLEVLRAVEEVSGRKVPYKIAPRRDGDSPSLVANSQKLQQALAWKPLRSDLHQIVRDAWNFFIKEQS